MATVTLRRNCPYKYTPHIILQQNATTDINPYLSYFPHCILIICSINLTPLILPVPVIFFFTICDWHQSIAPHSILLTHIKTFLIKGSQIQCATQYTVLTHSGEYAPATGHFITFSFFSSFVCIPQRMACQGMNTSWFLPGWLSQWKRNMPTCGCSVPVTLQGEDSPLFYLTRIPCLSQKSKAYGWPSHPEAFWSEEFTLV